jgi:hypothetical protein
MIIGRVVDLVHLPACSAQKQFDYIYFSFIQLLLLRYAFSFVQGRRAVQALSADTILQTDCCGRDHQGLTIKTVAGNWPSLQR